MRWRVRSLGCLVAAAIFVVMGVVMVGLLALGPLTGNGRGPLSASDFRPGQGMEDAPDKRVGGSVGPVPTWRVTSEVPVSFSVTLRNDGDTDVRVTGVRRDPDGDDHQFAPERIDDAPVTLRPGESRSVTVHGRGVCEEKYGGQITGKNGQTFVYDEGETQNLDFEALVDFVPCR